MSPSQENLLAECYEGIENCKDKWDVVNLAGKVRKLKDEITKGLPKSEYENVVIAYDKKAQKLLLYDESNDPQNKMYQSGLSTLLY